MEGSFTGGFYLDLSKYEPVLHDMGRKEDFILMTLAASMPLPLILTVSSVGGRIR